MTETINLFIIDKDLRIRESGKYEVGDTDKIRIKSGGTENWNPLIGETTYIEKKGWKKYILFGDRNWRREYYIIRKGEKCIDFKTEDVPTPNPDKLKQANLVMVAKDIGKDANSGTPWYIWFILAINIISFIMILQIAGVLA